MSGYRLLGNIDTNIVVVDRRKGNDKVNKLHVKIPNITQSLEKIASPTIITLKSLEHKTKSGDGFMSPRNVDVIKNTVSDKQDISGNERKEMSFDLTDKKKDEEEEENWMKLNVFPIEDDETNDEPVKKRRKIIETRISYLKKIISNGCKLLSEMKC